MTSWPSPANILTLYLPCVFFKRIHTVFVEFRLDDDFISLQNLKLYAASAAAVAKSGLARNGRDIKHHHAHLRSIYAFAPVHSYGRSRIKHTQKQYIKNTLARQFIKGTVRMVARFIKLDNILR